MIECKGKSNDDVSSTSLPFAILTLSFHISFAADWEEKLLLSPCRFNLQTSLVYIGFHGFIGLAHALK